MPAENDAGSTSGSSGALDKGGTSSTSSALAGVNGAKAGVSGTGAGVFGSASFDAVDDAIFSARTRPLNRALQMGVCLLFGASNRTCMQDNPQLLQNGWCDQG